MFNALFDVFRKYLSAGLVLVVGLAVALIVLATVGWQLAVIVFAITLLLAVILMVLAAKRTIAEVKKFGAGLNRPGSRGYPFGS